MCSYSKLLRFIFICLIISGYSIKAFSQNPNPKYDKALADSLGSDEYGMKMYVLVILKTGPANITEKAKVDSLFAGHMRNINRLVDMNKLVVAGPLRKNEKAYRGIFILNVTTFEEAKKLMEADPAISSGMLDTELFHWYGSAALKMYLPFSEKVGKNNF